MNRKYISENVLYERDILGITYVLCLHIILYICNIQIYSHNVSMKFIVIHVTKSSIYLIISEQKFLEVQIGIQTDKDKNA